MAVPRYQRAEDGEEPLRARHVLDAHAGLGGDESGAVRESLTAPLRMHATGVQTTLGGAMGTLSVTWDGFSDAGSGLGLAQLCFGRTSESMTMCATVQVANAGVALRRACASRERRTWHHDWYTVYAWRGRYRIRTRHVILVAVQLCTLQANNTLD